MDELYREAKQYISPISAENILSINSKFCEEDGFLPRKRAIIEIEPKLYSAYYRFLNKIDDKQNITENFISSLIPEVAGCIAYYIASTQIFPTANKRTAAESAELLLFMNNKRLVYKETAENRRNELVDILSGIGEKSINIDETIKWFKLHSLNALETYRDV
jgi:prophage maintenance system killer protein